MSQLSDARILEAHVRDGRDVFVTDDEKDFIHDGRRERLEAELRTRILTRVEAIAEISRFAPS